MELLFWELHVLRPGVLYPLTSLSAPQLFNIYLLAPESPFSKKTDSLSVAKTVGFSAYSS